MIDISNELRKEIISYIENKKLYQKYFLEYIYLKIIYFTEIGFMASYGQKNDNEGCYELQIRAAQNAEESFFSCHFRLKKDGTQQYKLGDYTFEYEIIPKQYIAQIFRRHFDEKSSILSMAIPNLYFPLAGSCMLRVFSEETGLFPTIFIRVLQLTRSEIKLSGDMTSKLNYDISILPILFDMIEDNMISNIEEIQSIYHSITHSYLDLENQSIEIYRKTIEREIMTKKALEEMIRI